MLYTLLKGEGQGRLLRFAETGEPMQRREEYMTPEAQERVWKHTLAAIEV
jgi:hypothetical protein